ncbi:Transposable element Tcb1 transposase, partial [Stegodyphus mimosarum]
MSTKRKRLHKGGLYVKRSTVCVPLKSRHRRERLRWACQHILWTTDQWRAVFFTDESRFSVQSDSRHYLIWREPGTCYHPSNIQEKDAYGGGSACVWGGISLGECTDLYVFLHGAMNAQACRDHILDAYVRPYARAISNDLLLQDDKH